MLKNPLIALALCGLPASTVRSGDQIRSVFTAAQVESESLDTRDRLVAHFASTHGVEQTDPGSILLLVNGQRNMETPISQDPVLSSADRVGVMGDGRQGRRKEYHHQPDSSLKPPPVLPRSESMG